MHRQGVGGVSCWPTPRGGGYHGVGFRPPPGVVDMRRTVCLLDAQLVKAGVRLAQFLNDTFE